MNTSFIFIYILTIIFLIIAFIKDKNKTKKALIIALKSFFRLLPAILMITIIIGLLLSFVTQGQISKVVGERAGFSGLLITALLGAILHIPSLVSFPLAASILKNGASVASVAVFITTLTMIGIVTLPIEIKFLGKKIALFRNGLSFIFAIIIGIIIGMLL